MFLDSFLGPCCPPQSFWGALCKLAQLVQLQLLRLLLGAGTGWLLKPAYVAMLHQLPQPALTSWELSASLTRGGTSSKRTLGALALVWKAPWFGKCCPLLLQEWSEGIFKGMTGKIGRWHKMETALNSTKKKNTSFSVGKLTSFSKPGLFEHAFLRQLNARSFSRNKECRSRFEDWRLCPGKQWLRTGFRGHSG